jgi:hypothetical protein
MRHPLPRLITIPAKPASDASACPPRPGQGDAGCLNNLCQESTQDIRLLSSLDGLVFKRRCLVDEADQRQQEDEEERRGLWRRWRGRGVGLSFFLLPALRAAPRFERGRKKKSIPNFSSPVTYLIWLPSAGWRPRNGKPRGGKRLSFRGKSKHGGLLTSARATPRGTR